jgi:APA family basic amino acid/polyamine antiporter
MIHDKGAAKLGPWGAMSLVVGTVIGTGIFLKAAIMSQSAGSIPGVVCAWIVAAILSALGGLCYAELGSRFPHNGGEYIFIQRRWGNGIGFLYGWTRFWIASPSAISAYAVGAATFAAGFVDVASLGGRTAIALALIWSFTLINCFKVTFGGGVQVALTALKVGLIIAISAGILLLSPDASTENLLSGPNFQSESLVTHGFGAAVLAALWAFDGWNNMPMAASEIADGQKNVPRAIILGLTLVTGLYLLANVAWFYGVTFADVVSSNSTAYPDAQPVATKAVLPFLGQTGIAFISFAFVLSAIGAMNGSILTSARVPSTMAADGNFPALFARINPSTGTPVFSLIIQGMSASILAASGTFDQLTDYVVFSSWLWYAIAAYGLFKFRTQDRGFQGYQIKWFPLVPALFIVSSIWLMLQAIWSNPQACATGVVIIATGIPVYLYRGRNRGR